GTLPRVEDRDPRLAQLLQKTVVVEILRRHAARVATAGERRGLERGLVRHGQQHEPRAAQRERALKRQNGGDRIGVNGFLTRVERIFFTTLLGDAVEEARAADVQDAWREVEPAVVADDGQLVAHAAEAGEPKLSTRLNPGFCVRGILDALLDLTQ